MCDIMDSPHGVHNILEIHNDDYINDGIYGRCLETAFMWGALSPSLADGLHSSLLVVARLCHRSYRNIVALVERDKVLLAASVHQMVHCLLLGLITKAKE